MLRNFLTIALRNILKNKGYSFINVFGLSLGIACFLLMFSYVKFEFSYDNFHPNLDRTFRVDQKRPWDAPGEIIGSTAPPMANALLTNYPEVEDAMRINTPGDFIIRYDGPQGVLAFNETKVFAADSNFFSFFGFEMKEGNPLTALRGVNKVVISEEVSRKYFGDGSALGKILQLGDQKTALEITGVTKRLPENTHFHFDYLLSMDTNPNVKKRDWSWVWIQVATYIRLREDANPKELGNKLGKFATAVIKPGMEQRGMDFDNNLKQGSWDFFLTPIKDVHLYAQNSRLGPVSNYKYPVTFAVVGVFVLIIASINFVNLSTARATKRAKEVGVKKTLGAKRNLLIYQFQSESILLTLISTVFAIVVMEGLRLLISNLSGIQIPAIWNDPLVFLIPILPLVIGFLAGLYPSYYLTAFRPAQVLKGKLSGGAGNVGLRNVLVAIQFTISIALIAGTMIVFEQISFVSTKNLGFDKENILLINYADKLGTQLEAFRTEIENYPGVVRAGTTSVVPGGNTWSDGLTKEGSNDNLGTAFVKADENYFNTLNFELVAGRGFEDARLSDKNAIIPNENAVRELGWTPEQAIGKYLVYPGGNNSRHEIIGVVKDFHYSSLYEGIFPVVFFKIDSDMWGDWRVLTVKFKTSDVGGLIRQINSKWNNMLDNTPMDYSFLDHDLQVQYQHEQRLGNLFGIFSGLSIVIAVIGLVGLVAYSAEVRKKEIGIRKVFGASVPRIVVLINSQYIKLIFIGFLLATPLTWWAINEWLNSFAFRIDISSLTFVFAAIVELILAMVSVGYLSLRAAMLNPSQVLKEE
jgi:putative ABC transport system permease protein